MIRGYDQWKTASPYDDELDWSDMGIVCPKCGIDCVEDLDTTNYPVVDFYCDDCRYEWTQDVNKPAITPEQKNTINAIENELQELERTRKRNTGLTIDEFFENCPDGDFKYESDEAGDWHVYCCGEKDCEQQWHLVAYAENIGRENGKRYVELMTVDSDGDWDYTSGYDERENDKETDWYFFAKEIANQTDEFFQGWAEYWLDSAITGKDPCNQILGPIKENWTEFCIEAARDNLEYLKMGK